MTDFIKKIKARTCCGLFYRRREAPPCVSGCKGAGGVSSGQRTQEPLDMERKRNPERRGPPHVCGGRRPYYCTIALL